VAAEVQRLVEALREAEETCQEDRDHTSHSQ
jgi:ABC-type nitrate/sulfonate/bicarbonate transport system substrate-binding protein